MNIIHTKICLNHLIPFITLKTRLGDISIGVSSDSNRNTYIHNC